MRSQNSLEENNKCESKSLRDSGENYSTGPWPRVEISSYVLIIYNRSSVVSFYPAVEQIWNTIYVSGQLQKIQNKDLCKLKLKRKSQRY